MSLSPFQFNSCSSSHFLSSIFLCICIEACLIMIQSFLTVLQTFTFTLAFLNPLYISYMHIQECPRYCNWNDSQNLQQMQSLFPFIVKIFSILSKISFTHNAIWKALFIRMKYTRRLSKNKS